MATLNLKKAVAVMAIGTLALAASPPSVQAQEPTIEPEATRLLKRMTDYLGGLESFSLDADNMLEDVLLSGQKIQYDFTSEVLIQRPNKVRVERTGDLS
jgi:hypothetical protein